MMGMELARRRIYIMDWWVSLTTECSLSGATALGRASEHHGPEPAIFPPARPGATDPLGAQTISASP